MTAGSNELSRSQQYRMNRSFNPNPLPSPKNLIWNNELTIISSFYETVVTTAGFFIDHEGFSRLISEVERFVVEALQIQHTTNVQVHGNFQFPPSISRKIIDTPMSSADYLSKSTQTVWIRIWIPQSFSSNRSSPRGQTLTGDTEERTLALDGTRPNQKIDENSGIDYVIYRNFYCFIFRIWAITWKGLCQGCCKRNKGQDGITWKGCCKRN